MADFLESNAETDSARGLGSAYPSTTNPTEVYSNHYVWSFPPGKQYKNFRHLQKIALGKWMVFRPYSQLDNTWDMVRREVEDGVLTEKSLAALSTTMFYDPSAQGPGPQVSGVISVYSTEEDADQVGFILVKLAKHDIKYKTEEATNKHEYVWRGDRHVSLKTIYWNNGNPSFVLEGELCSGPERVRVTDLWHLNHVTAPESAITASGACYGRWVIAPGSDNLTSLWHYLKQDIEEGLLGPVEMVCPPRINWRDKSEEAVFHVYTARRNKEMVGLSIATIVKKDITYELNRMFDRGWWKTPVYNHRIIWDQDEPIYVMTLVR